MRRLLLFLTFVGSLYCVQAAVAVGDCPGLCLDCRQAAVSVCGPGCVMNVSCSLSQCTCSFSCRTPCTQSPQGVSSRQGDSLRPMLDPRLELASWQPAMRYSPANVKIDIIDQPDVPLSIENVSIHGDSGRQISELSYTLTNKSGFNVQSASLFVSFFNDRNEPLGGEIINVGESCGPTQGEAESKNFPRTDKELLVPLKHFVDSGDRVSLAILNYHSDARSWTGDRESIITTMKLRK